MKKLIKPGRLAVFYLLLAVLTAVFLVAMYRAMIVRGAAAEAEANGPTVTTVSVPAARGAILDRYGRVLVSSVAHYYITIDAVELFAAEDPNAQLLAMARLFTDCGADYTDTLPITADTPFAYTDTNEDQQAALDAFIAANDLAPAQGETGISAQEMIAAMRKRYDVDESFSDREARIIVGLRFEINSRYICTGRSEYIFAENIDNDTLTRLIQSEIRGYDVNTAYTREYDTSFGGNLLGYISAMGPGEYEETYKALGYSFSDLVGRDGAEKAFESYLHGTSGTMQVSTDANGVVVSREYITEPVPGSNVYLTADFMLQAEAESALASFIAQLNSTREQSNALAIVSGKPEDVLELSTGGAVVVMDVESFEPLALANYPTYSSLEVMEDYNAVLETDNDPLFNRCLMGLYEPGSTFKPVVAAAALCEGALSLDTIITCTGTFDKYKEEAYAPHCWIYPGWHGDLTVTQAITHSCNFFFYTLGDLLGIRVIDEYAARFGLGQPTGIELPETLGYVASPEKKMEIEGLDWYAGDNLQAAIGQSYTQLTPMQIAAYVTTLANGGQRYSCSILREVRSYNYARTIASRQRELLADIELPEGCWEAIRDGMVGAAMTADGTAYATFGSYPVKVACKTGTVQSSKAANDSVFICYAPADDPEIAIAVVVENGGSGAALAPVARQILDYCFSGESYSAAADTEYALLK